MQNSQQIFKLHSEYHPTGDQPQAIEQLVKGFKEGNQFETLLGVTGSGTEDPECFWCRLLLPFYACHSIPLS